jgi:mycobactin peptide synthetase MbtE
MTQSTSLSATETVVADVVARTLGISTVPCEASVFDLGATSVSVARICAGLEQGTGIKVQISQVFRTPTVGGLAAWLDERRAAPGTQPAGQSRGSGLIELTPMMAAGAGMGIMSDVVWWLDGLVDDVTLERAATDIHLRHEALQACYVTSGPALGYAVLPAAPGTPEFLRLPVAETDAAAVDALRAALAAPLHIEDGHVWRCVLAASTASGRCLFAISVDHTAFDGRSAGIVARELSIAYAARAAGREPDFGAPAATLAQIGAEYREQLASTDLDAQREYWRGEFSGVPACYLPGHSSEVRPRGIGPVAEPVFTIEAARTAPWREYARGRGMTGFVWLAAAYTQTLIDLGAPLDLGFMFGIANRGSDMMERSVTCRVKFAFLRPNSPARVAASSDILARANDAYNHAMANMEGCLGHEEIPAAVGSTPGEFPMLQALPHVINLDGAARTIKLGDVTGTAAPEFTEWGTGPADISTEITHGADAQDIRVKVAVRTDAYPADLADQIGERLSGIITEGPGRLAQRTTT